MLTCELFETGFSLRMSYDDRILEPMAARRVAHQFEKILQKMCMEYAATTKFKDVQTAAIADFEFLWNQNAGWPEEPTLYLQD